MRTLAAVTPLLMRYRKTGKIHAIAEDEFETSHYLKLENYHVVVHYLHSYPMNLGYMQDVGSEKGRRSGRSEDGDF